MAENTNSNATNEVKLNKNGNPVRKRKSFEEAKAARVAKIEKQIKDTEAHLEALNAKLKEEKAKTRQVSSRMSDKTKAKKIIDIAVQAGKTPAEIAKALGIDIPETLK